MSLINVATNSNVSTEDIYTQEKHYDKVLFDIDTRPMQIVHPLTGELSDSGYSALVRSDTNSVLYVGNKYTPLHNKLIAEGIERIIDQTDMELERVVNYNDRKFKFELVNRKEGFTVRKEVGHPMIRIVNSYDGSMAFRLQVGLMVQVCTNGAFALRGEEFKKKHFNGLDISEFISKFASQYKTPELREYSVDDIQKVYEKITEKIPDGKDKINPVKSLLISKIDGFYKQYNDATFALFMATTELSTHSKRLGIPYSYAEMLDNGVSKYLLN